MPIGPTLPPSAEKRKRSHESSSSDSEDDLGPQPPQSNDVEQKVAKKARVLGPAPPPAPLSERPEMNSSKDDADDGSSDDDDFGPSLPIAANTATTNTRAQASNPSKLNSSVSIAATRDEWMTLAPSSGDWSQRVDPTKLKSRKFNTGKSNTTSKAGSDAWNETPAEKQARLQREVLGVKDRSTPQVQTSPDTANVEDRDTKRRLAEHNAQRGPSLYDAHQNSQKAEKDDDPSAREFDREKDIGGGLQINATQRRDMMKKSSDFNSRFSSAKYL